MPKKTIMRSLTIKELSGVDRPAQVGAKALIMKRADSSKTVKKLEDMTPEAIAALVKRGMAVLTTATDGHTHLVMREDYEGNKVVSGTTTWQDEHTHPWIEFDDGTVLIGEVAGHNHEADKESKLAGNLDDDDDDSKNPKHKKKPKRRRNVSTVHKGKGLARILNRAIDNQKDDDTSRSDIISSMASSAGIDTGTVNEILAGKIINPPAARLRGFARTLNVSLSSLQGAARADQKSEGKKTSTENTTHKDFDMKDETRIAELEGQLQKSQAIAKFNDATKAYFETLDDAGKDSFVEKSADDQAADVASFTKAADDADPVVYKSDSGDVYRKSDDSRLIAMAKQGDLDRKDLAKQKETNKRQDLEKRAGEILPNLPGTIQARASLLEKAESISDETERTDALAALKASNDALDPAFKSLGAGGGPQIVDGSAEQQLQKLADDYAKENKVPNAEAYTKVLETDEGAKLYQQHKDSANGARTH